MMHSGTTNMLAKLVKIEFEDQMFEILKEEHNDFEALFRDLREILDNEDDTIDSNLKAYQKASGFLSIQISKRKNEWYVNIGK